MRKCFSLEKSKKIDKISYYYLKDSQSKKLTKIFQRTEFPINNNFTA